jgi:hypothetical protein
VAESGGPWLARRPFIGQADDYLGRVDFIGKAPQEIRHTPSHVVRTLGPSRYMTRRYRV